jgi:hypothetical protein
VRWHAFDAALAKSKPYMKHSVVVVAILQLLAFGSCKEKEKVIQVVDEKPADVFHVDLCETLSSTVISLLSPSSDNKAKYPELFSSSNLEKVKLVRESEVYVSYVTESASMPSTLGFYTYSGSDPENSSDIHQEIAFPHLSSSVLVTGDTRRLGKFPAGTTIGFFVIVGGYSDNTVNFSKQTYWTNYAWNSGGERQHILFRESNCDNIVMAFEDKSVGAGVSDKDYNDLIFIISDNPNNATSTAFDLNALPSM